MGAGRWQSTVRQSRCKGNQLPAPHINRNVMHSRDPSGLLDANLFGSFQNTKLLLLRKLTTSHNTPLLMFLPGESVTLDQFVLFSFFLAQTYTDTTKKTHACANPSIKQRHQKQPIISIWSIKLVPRFVPRKVLHEKRGYDLHRNPLISLVGARRFERPTPCSQGRCAAKLRYAPKHIKLENSHEKSKWLFGKIWVTVQYIRWIAILQH
jgi:hypothetical protein